MAERVKKATTTTKPRTATAKKKPVMANPNVITISREEIAQLAHRYWAERGHQHGQAEEDWFRAEQELRSKAS